MLDSLLGGPGVPGTSPEMLALFVAFGLVVGILFGLFGMGGSFLVTPALLMLDYEPSVAVAVAVLYTSVVSLRTTPEREATVAD